MLASIQKFRGSAHLEIKHVENSNTNITNEEITRRVRSSDEVVQSSANSTSNSETEARKPQSQKLKRHKLMPYHTTF